MVAGRQLEGAKPMPGALYLQEERLGQGVVTRGLGVVRVCREGFSGSACMLSASAVGTVALFMCFSLRLG